MLKYLFFKAGYYFIRIFPLSTSYWIACCLSDLVYLFNKKDCHIIQHNLSIIRIEKDQHAFLTREVFRNFGRYLVEFMAMDKFLTPEYTSKNVEVKNIERIKEVLDKGKGGIILSAHLGNWELGGAVLSQLGYPMTAVALEHKEEKVNAFFNQQRTSIGIDVVPPSIALRKCIRDLCNNKLIGMIADRTFGTKGEMMDFFGYKMMVPKGPAVFAQKTKSAIIPTFLIRKSDNQFILSIEEPIYAESFSDDEQGVLELMNQYTRVLESKVRQHPGQWIMFKEIDQP